MSVDGFRVDSDRLLQHATRLGAVSEAIGVAADAAGQVDLHDGAFGLLCAFLPPFVNGAEVSTGDAIGASLETMDAIIDNVKGMAAGYTAADETVGTGFDRAGSGTGGAQWR